MSTAASMTTTPTARFASGSIRLGSGDVATTTSGRATAPFPEIDLSTSRRAANTVRRGRTWLLAEATAELEYRRRPAIEHFLTGVESMEPGNWSTSDGDTCEAILFDPEFWRD
jgi:hypothetical protein